VGILVLCFRTKCKEVFQLAPLSPTPLRTSNAIFHTRSRPVASPIRTPSRTYDCGKILLTVVKRII